MCEVQIKTSPEPFSGSISVVARHDYTVETGSRVEFFVTPNVSFGRPPTMSAEDARDIADWWRLAAQVAEVLPVYFKTVADLKRKIKALLMGRTITFEWVE